MTALMRVIKNLVIKITLTMQYRFEKTRNKIYKPVH